MADAVELVGSARLALLADRLEEQLGRPELTHDQRVQGVALTVWVRAEADGARFTEQLLGCSGPRMPDGFRGRILADSYTAPVKAALAYAGVVNTR